jgi:hypothetical protein
MGYRNTNFSRGRGRGRGRGHLNNILFLVRPNALRVKFVTSQATWLPLASSILNKDTNLKALP